jgi:hypothetical protein
MPMEWPEKSCDLYSCNRKPRDIAGNVFKSLLLRACPHMISCYENENAHIDIIGAILYAASK